MTAILEQLGLDQTFFAQLIIFAVLFFFLSRVYFKPFQALFEMRHKKTVEDREAAERLMVQAQKLFDDYKNRLAEERSVARKEFEETLDQAKKEESKLLAHAREEAKKITQEAADSVAAQSEKLRKQLETDVEGIAQSISERLLSRKV